jgi:CRISPR/Cas system CMR-associated protein Cmr3 (group 5 of RAMP superfamily)
LRQGLIVNGIAPSNIDNDAARAKSLEGIMAYSIIGGSRFWQYRHDIVETIEKTMIAGFEAGLESLDESPVGV